MIGRRARVGLALGALLLATLASCAPTPHAARSAGSADTPAGASAGAEVRRAPEVRSATEHDTGWFPAGMRVNNCETS